MISKSEFETKLQFIKENVNKLSDGGLQREFDTILKHAFESDASIHKKELETALDKLTTGRSYLKEELLKQVELNYAQSAGRKRARS